MKDLSIIIVNYNVKHFLNECLHSIEQSKDALDKEIIVVDNASVDDSLIMLKSDYPSVKLIANVDNVGFGKANNQGVKISKSKYILFLNPDTILQEDTLQKCFDTMEQNEKIGSLGVSMYDGRGKFLPESKRSVPTLWSSFCKITGLWKLSPNSKFLNNYYLGHLSNTENHEIEVLTGAFMFTRKSALDITGCFDEQFFMYGEDIDLSYKIKQAGYQNYFLSDTSIIHFKGESTKKSSVSYTKHFYNAMLIFNNKHRPGNSSAWTVLINLAIVIVAISSQLKSWLMTVLHPMIDLSFIYFSYQGIKYMWSRFYWKDIHYYDDIDFYLLALLFSLLFIVGLIFTGHYKKKSGFDRFLGGWLIGALLVFLVYNFLPFDLRFSRAIIFISSILLFPFLWYIKLFFNKIATGSWVAVNGLKKKIILVGSKDSIRDLKSKFQTYFKSSTLLTAVSQNDSLDGDTHSGTLGQLSEISKKLKPDEIVFCSKDLSHGEIIHQMSTLGNQFSYRIANQDNAGILGSDSKNAQGSWYSKDLKINLTMDLYLLQKRILDITLVIIFMPLFPLILLISPRRKNFLSGFIPVLIGTKTWVGYASSQSQQLPLIKDGVFSVSENYGLEYRASREAYESDLEYASYYNVWKDFIIIMKNLLPGKP